MIRRRDRREKGSERFTRLGDEKFRAVGHKYTPKQE
jgi:hypothetical protein